jgi:hypothetical protein
MIEKHIHLVKGQISYYRQQIERFPPTSDRYRPSTVALYEQLLQQHQELLAYLEGQASAVTAQPEQPTPTPSKAMPDLAQALSQVRGAVRDLFDPLPPELLKQLSSRATRGKTDPLVKIINEHGGTATLDDILISLYRETGEISRRNIIANRLYRLAKQGLVSTVPDRKGVYTAQPPADS